MYSYMPSSEGWFAMFRGRSLPSTFLTAFGLETLADSIEADWEYILFIGLYTFKNVFSI